MKREIIGYQLAKPEFEKAAISVMETQPDYYAVDNWNIDLRGKGYDKSLPVECPSTLWLKKAGVLKLWFKPIYKEEEEILVVKKGDWLYILSPEGYNGHTGDVVRVTKVSKDDVEANAVWINHTPNSFSGGGFRCSKTIFPYGKAFRLATKAEIEAYLSSEAIRRYPSGTTVNQQTAYGGIGSTYKTKGIYVSCSPTGKKYDHINVSIGGIGVYSTEHNIWAEIVTNPAPEIKINGYDAKFKGNTVSFGCQTLTYEMVQRLAELLEYKIHLVDSDGDDITSKVVEIYDYLSELKN